MLYLKTYSESNEKKDQDIIITDIPINQHIFNLIVKHYDLLITLNVNTINKFLIKSNELNEKLFIRIIITPQTQTFYRWNTMKYLTEKNNLITIEDWLNKHYPGLTIDEVIQSNKLGLL